MNAKLTNVKGKGPVVKTRSGKFQVSVWHWKEVVPPRGDTKDLFAEKEIDIRRVCLRHSRWNRKIGAWNESMIWCDPDDLRSLVSALEDLNEKVPFGEAA